LIAGGFGGLVLRFYSRAEIYDPSSGTFTSTGDMTEPLADTASLLPNGKVLITKSVFYDPPNGDGNEIFVRHTELYEPSNGTFARSEDSAEFHATPTATLLMNGRVLIAGGGIGDGDGKNCPR
jgi:hypothetical protein